MSKLDELISELCPNGVEYIPIGEVVKYEQPTKYIVNNTEYSDEFTIPVLTAGQSFILGYTSENQGIYNATKDNPVIIFDDFTGAFQWVDFPFKVKSSAMKILTVDESKIMIRYIFHVMGNIGFVSDEHKRLWIRTYSEIKVPFPPMQIQREIVRILDNFTELTAELTVELTARKKQYEYYRDKLLNFGEGWEINDVVWRNLSQIADIGTGSSNTNEASEDGIYPFFVRSQEPLRKNKYEFDETAIITAGDGVGVGKVYHFVEGKYALHQRAYRIHINTPKVLPKYFFHYMKAMFLPYIQKTMFQSSVSSIRRPMLNDFPVPVPSLKVQERLVHVLDNFETICSDLNIGLPAEIELRKKQYEYYRDVLLTFTETGNMLLTDRQTDRQTDRT